MLLKVAFTSKFVFATITFNVQLLLYYQVVTFVIVQAHRKKDTSSTFQFTTATPLIMWEVAGLLFLVSETKDMVEKGMGFFSESLLLSGCLRGAPLIFFLDKDFDYINVVEDIFPGCLVFHPHT